MERTAAVLQVDLRLAWPVLLLRGVFAVALGLVALTWPAITLLALAWAFGVYAVVDGITQITDGILRRQRPRWWVSVLLGLLGLLAGAVALIWPGITALVLAVVVGAWALANGAVEIMSAVRQRRERRRGAMLVVAGLLSVVAGALILFWPGAGAFALALLVGAFAVLYGVVLAALALALRNAAGSPASEFTSAPAAP
jgi:uncharacterized membrane protein HdeD (DUF308 family)